MAAPRVSDTRVTGANYEAHYPLIRGQFVKQIKAVCDIDCQNNQHSFQLLFFYWNLQRKVFCQPTNFVEHVSSYQESSGNWGCRVPGALYQVPRAENKRTMNVQGFLNYQLLLHLKCILRVTCRRNKYFKHCFSSYSYHAPIQRTPVS